MEERGIFNLLPWLLAGGIVNIGTARSGLKTRHAECETDTLPMSCSSFHWVDSKKYELPGRHKIYILDITRIRTIRS
jgi:hypothetical protein